MQEALDFLKEIDSSASKKLTYNIEKVKLGVKDTCLRSSQAPTFGSSAQSTAETATDCYPFGTQGQTR